MAGASVSQGRIARRARISGRVQGVFFRDSLRRLAASVGVAGWASNRLDGTVELWAEGAPEAVERVIELAQRGPPRAAVERVEVEEVEPAGLEGFEVR